MEEQWRTIVKYPSYEVSSAGRVRSKSRIDARGNKRKGRLMSSYITCFGYRRINLFENGKRKNEFVHRLVASAFLKNPNNLNQVNHKDGNKLNNSASNLEWCTNGYNQRHAYMLGLKHGAINNKTNSKAIVQYSLDGDFVRRYPSSKEAQRQTGFRRENICACCRGALKTSYGYIWRFAE